MRAHPSLTMAHAVADFLDHPNTAPLPSCTMSSERRQLAYGPLGIALLHIERAASGLGPWQRVHDWLAAATRQPFTSGADSHPFYGAPALAHTVACAAEHAPGGRIVCGLHRGPSVLGIRDVPHDHPRCSGVERPQDEQRITSAGRGRQRARRRKAANFVTHNLENARIADRIIVLDGGRAV